METVELVFTYTQSEYVKAAREYLIASKTMRKFDIYILAVCFPLSTVYLFLSNFSVISIIFFTVLIIASILGFMAYFYIPVRNYRMTSKFHEEYRLRFSNDIMIFKTPTIDSEIKWDVYSEAWENKDFYYLIQAPQMYTLIPKRAFANDANMQTFEKIVLNSLNTIKRLK